MPVLQVGELRCEPGQLSEGWLYPALDDDGLRQRMAVPVVLINGAWEGPTLAVTAGVHGGEYPGIEACLRLTRFVDARNLRGRLIVVPRVNGAAFFARSVYVNPVDGVNLNRVFPGRSDGSPTERLAHLISTEVIGQSDYYVDLHSGDLNEDLIDYVFYGCTGDSARDEVSIALASQFETDYVISSRTSGSSLTAARQYGIPCVLSESGGGGRLDEKSVSFHLNGVGNVLSFLGMYPGLGTPRAARRPSLVAWAVSEHTGYLRIGVSVGERVVEGQALGDIRDDFGKPLATVVAPMSGVLLFKLSSFAVNAGDLVLGVVSQGPT